MGQCNVFNLKKKVIVISSSKKAILGPMVLRRTEDFPPTRCLGPGSQFSLAKNKVGDRAELARVSGLSSAALHGVPAEFSLKLCTRQTLVVAGRPRRSGKSTGKTQGRLLALGSGGPI